VPDLKSLTKPIPVLYDTFDKLIKLKNENKIRAVKMFGTDKRFREVKPEHPNHPKNTPGPGAHDIVAKWREKPAVGQKAEKKDPHWMNKITKGVERSIYYD